ncbi:MAG: hypothetical protein U9N85_13740 [Bacteroidota bacterium]|nr:hypothetical protein [Bacteroidota bacterium]
MKILIVSATQSEEAGIRKFVDKTGFKQHQITFLCTGPSIPLTVFSLTKHLSVQPYDLCINIGVCGSFSDHYPPGKVLNITHDQFADIGIRQNDTFQPIFDAEFWDTSSEPFDGNSMIENKCKFSPNLIQANAITVNVTSGNAQQIAQRLKRFNNPDTESMEGAAFAYVCKKMNTEYLQIRAVSNRVEPYNKESWNMGLALKNLSDELIKFIKKLP